MKSSKLPETDSYRDTDADNNTDADGSTPWLPLEIDVLTMIGYNPERSNMKGSKQLKPYNEMVVIVLNRKDWGGSCKVQVVHPNPKNVGDELSSSLTINIKAHSIQSIVIPL